MMTDYPAAATLVIETWSIRCDDPFLIVKPGAVIRVTISREQEGQKQKREKQGHSTPVKKRSLTPGQYSLNTIIDDATITHTLLTFEERGGMQKHFVIKRMPDQQSFLVSEILGIIPDAFLIS